MIPTQFDRFVKSVLTFTRASDLSAVPELPGIYAWFLPLECDHDEEAGLIGLATSLRSKVARAAELTKSHGDVGQETIGIRRAVPHFDAKVMERLGATVSTSDLEELAALLLALSVLSPPIYVGMTAANQGLRSRISAHLSSGLRDRNWMGNFRARVVAGTNDLDYLRRCIVAYCPLDPSRYPVSFPRLVEHLLIRVIRPAHNKRG